MRHGVCDLAGFFVGSWHIVRRIRDAATGRGGTLRGWGAFSLRPGELLYEERGALAFDLYVGEATQRYRFVLETPAVASVRFHNGALFHRLDLCSGAADVIHECAPDTYRGRYRVRDRDHWTQSWSVHGPRKHLLIGTRFFRAADTMW